MEIADDGQADRSRRSRHGPDPIWPSRVSICTTRGWWRSPKPRPVGPWRARDHRRQQGVPRRGAAAGDPTGRGIWPGSTREPTTACSMQPTSSPLSRTDRGSRSPVSRRSPPARLRRRGPRQRSVATMPQSDLQGVPRAHPDRHVIRPVIAVLGADGQLGSAFGRLLGDSAPVARHELDLDLGDLVRSGPGSSRERPDPIINCAAYTAVDAAETDEKTARTVNALAVGALAEALRQARCSSRHLLHRLRLRWRRSRPATSRAIHPKSAERVRPHQARRGETRLRPLPVTSDRQDFVGHVRHSPQLCLEDARADGQWAPCRSSTINVVTRPSPTTLRLRRWLQSRPEPPGSSTSPIRERRPGSASPARSHRSPDSMRSW